MARRMLKRCLVDRSRPEYDIAISFLRLKAHEVGRFSLGTYHSVVDGVCVSDLGLIALAQMHGQEWVDYLEKTRFAEVMEHTQVAVQKSGPGAKNSPITRAGLLKKR